MHPSIFAFYEPFGNSKDKIMILNESGTSKKFKNPADAIFESADKFSNALDTAMDYDQIFSVVKKTVKSATGRERSGLGLALADLPPTLGAFWQVGGNYIVMNENLVYAMIRLCHSTREFNSFIYMILTHEYLHSCGFIDEQEARNMTAVVSAKAFGNEHPASRMSSKDLWRLYPDILNVTGGNGTSFRIVSKFDSDSTSYIG